MDSESHARTPGKLAPSSSSSSSELGPFRFSELEAIPPRVLRGDLGVCSNCKRKVRPRGPASLLNRLGGGPPLPSELEVMLDFDVKCHSTHGGEWRDEFPLVLRAPRDELRAAVSYLLGALHADHAATVLAHWQPLARVRFLEFIVEKGLGAFTTAPSSDVTHLVLEGAAHAMCGGKFPSQVLIPSPSVGARCERCAARTWAMVKGEKAIRAAMAALANDEGPQILGRCFRCMESGR